MVSAPADLGQLNTLKVSARAERLVTVTCVEELVAALSDIPADSQVHILGGGSNVILHDTLPGTTILIAIKERTVLSRLNDIVPRKICAILVTCDTSHFEMSPWNSNAP